MYSPRLIDPSYLKGKRILLVAADFFHIPERITGALKRLGAECDWWDERPSNSFMTKALIRINRNLIAPVVNRYYSRIAEKTAARDYDYIFFIKGECVAASSLEKLRRLHPRAKFILYQWDSIDYNPQFLTIRPYFDKIVSFEPSDCDRYGMYHLPLFYPESFGSIQKYEDAEYDLMFVGTIHYNRYDFIRNVLSAADIPDNKVLKYLYIPHPLVYYKKKYLEHKLQGADRSYFKFSPLPFPRLLEFYSSSKIAIDTPKPGQNGLTLRTIETLGAKRKLITPNADIVNYDFYHPDNILVVDPVAPEIPKEFIEGPYHELPEEIYRAYSVDNWLANIFEPA